MTRFNYDAMTTSELADLARQAAQDWTLAARAAAGALGPYNRLGRHAGCYKNGRDYCLVGELLLADYGDSEGYELYDRQSLQTPSIAEITGVRGHAGDPTHDHLIVLTKLNDRGYFMTTDLLRDVLFTPGDRLRLRLEEGNE